MNYEKKEILEKICFSSRVSNLGLFIGSGFSKAVMMDSGKNMLSWLELLKRLCVEFNIKENLFKEGTIYPLIASKIIELVGEECRSDEEAEMLVKDKIALLVNDVPNNGTIEKFREYIQTINAEWIITTNYDNLIERIVGANAYPILPEYMFYKIKNIIPIYHIHGSVLKPNTIVISNEDYAKIMRISDYRYNRLPILMKEYTVLMIGYALGDLNVLSAIDYRNNVFNNKSSIENNIIQLVHTDNPRQECYEKNGVIIYEFSNLIDFFEEFKDYQMRYKSLIGKKVNKIKDKIKEFVNESLEYVDKFIFNESNYRSETIDFVRKLDNSYCYIYTPYISFLDRILENIFKKACSIAYNFADYGEYLNVLIDLIKNINVSNVPTIYLSFLIHKFDVISYFIGNKIGQSYFAYDIWNQRKKEIPKEFIHILRTSMNEISDKYSIKRLLDLIDSKCQ